MTNLLRKCENCVFGNKTEHAQVTECNPRIPNWMYPYLERQYNYVFNYEAETCEAFRLRETGVNE